MRKNRHNRREFLGLTGMGMAGIAGGTFLAPQSVSRRRRVIPRLEMPIWSCSTPRFTRLMPACRRWKRLRSRRPVRRGGSAAEIKALIGKGTQSFDAKQMTVVPGFIDCHNHAGGNTLLYEVIVGNPYEVEFVTIASIIDKLRAKAQNTPAGFWIDGFFFDDTKVKDNRQLNVHDLDQVSKEHPVVVHHRGGHTSYYNSKALELAGINKNTPNPMGGTWTMMKAANSTAGHRSRA